MSSKCILIIEDDEPSIKLYNALLQSHGFNTINSCDGMDIMELTRKHRPDLILMEIKLPQLSGIELIKILKADNDLKNTPVLAVTASVMPKETKAVLDAGFDDFIAKPISIPDFLIEIKKFLGLGRFQLIESLRTGHEQIDFEHEQIIALLNEFADCYDTGDHAGYSEKMSELLQALHQHLDHEEMIMDELNYIKLEEQKIAHSVLRNRLQKLLLSWDTANHDPNFPQRLNMILLEDFFHGDMDFSEYLGHKRPFK